MQRQECQSQQGQQQQQQQQQQQRMQKIDKRHQSQRRWHSIVLLIIPIIHILGKI